MSSQSTPKRTLRQRVPRIKFAPSGSEPKPPSPITTYYLILVPAVFLALFGLLMGFSASAVTNIAMGVNPYVPFLKMVGIAVLALGAAVGAALVPARLWEKFAPTVFLIALVLQIAVYFVGIGEGGNTNWLPIPGTGQVIQPSEFLKLATCLVLGRTLSARSTDLNNWKQVVVLAGLPALFAVGAVMLGGDMGTALVFVGLVFGALWVAGIKASWFAILGIAGGAAAILLVAISPSRTRRVLEFIPGFGTPPNTAAPTQTDHGLWALGSGGLTGLGPGASREKWNYLQEAHTDFILAIVGEEFGLIGSLTLLALLGLLIYGTLRLSANAKSRFIAITAGGVATWLMVQGLINIGTVTGLAPVIGVPFPLVSYGGSSFLFTAMAIGVLLSFAREEAGMRRKGRLNPDTAGRDPRRAPAPRTPRRSSSRVAASPSAPPTVPPATGLPRAPKRPAPASDRSGLKTQKPFDPEAS
ncbi:peptidoglycan glycosyltransferase FtsW [Actinomyces minihominis]|uniref:peptidoglycan glycosyltransferase FtsW n=1 Tax=Actinomyces minihominis TaxID=2002838 RepID=UPI000C089A1C|nr:putative peptidoglycan glycosyltransferase FtsW [Actinomyces minihominis]